jgi:hypothetical protein
VGEAGGGCLSVAHGAVLTVRSRKRGITPALPGRVWPRTLDRLDDATGENLIEQIARVSTGKPAFIECPALTQRRCYAAA